MVRRQALQAAGRFAAIWHKTTDVFLWLAAGLLIAISFAITVDVLIRYFFNKTFGGLFEISEFSLLWMTFLGTAAVLRKGGHVNVDLLVTRLPARHRMAIEVLTSGACTAVLVLLTWYSARVTWQDFVQHSHFMTVLQPPKWPIELIMPLGFLLMSGEAVGKTFKCSEAWRAKRLKAAVAAAAATLDRGQ
ncbi:MAG: TRAP transporter small permease [Chloroflexi bacterium]|nr:TRAP transporter small permease [Chloroflexota bacterium]